MNPQTYVISLPKDTAILTTIVAPILKFAFRWPPRTAKMQSQKGFKLKTQKGPIGSSAESGAFSQCSHYNQLPCWTTHRRSGNVTMHVPSMQEAPLRIAVNNTNTRPNNELSQVQILMRRRMAQFCGIEAERVCRQRICREVWHVP